MAVLRKVLKWWLSWVEPNSWERRTAIARRAPTPCRDSLLLLASYLAVILQLVPHSADVVLGIEEQSGSNLADALPAGDLDESPEGRQRLQEIEKRASQLFTERDKVVRDRRPFALRRDTMLGEVAQARERVARNQTTATATARQIAQLENQVKWLAGAELKELRSKQSRLQTSLNTQMRRISSDRSLLDERTTQISALSLQIASLDQRVVLLEEELSECRRQWLGIHQPLEKYSRCDFEGLRRVLDDWLVMDGQWPEAFAWAALCAYELDEISSAAVYLEKAQKLRVELSGSKKMWPQLEALTGLIRQKQLGQSAKADAALTNAVRLADRNSDWQAYFLVGRCYSERPADGARAKAHLERALAIQPNCDCAKLWLARLQTTSTLASVRDLPAGTACLEDLWVKSGRKSWRLAKILAEAYTASQRVRDAESMWKTAAELAPEKFKHRLVRNGGGAQD